jgi:hypothetical protein
MATSQVQVIIIALKNVLSGQLSKDTFSSD